MYGREKEHDREISTGEKCKSEKEMGETEEDREQEAAGLVIRDKVQSPHSALYFFFSLTVALQDKNVRPLPSPSSPPPSFSCCCPRTA